MSQVEFPQRPLGVLVETAQERLKIHMQLVMSRQVLHLVVTPMRFVASAVWLDILKDS